MKQSWKMLRWCFSTRNRAQISVIVLLCIALAQARMPGTLQGMLVELWSELLPLFTIVAVFLVLLYGYRKILSPFFKNGSKK